jgi:SAM-dependent methyltransferase
MGTIVVSAVAGAAAGAGGGIVKDRFLATYKRRLDDRAELRSLQSCYKGRILEAALDWDRRMTQLYEGAYQWLDPEDHRRADPEEYYFQSVVFRFLQLAAIARRFEGEAFYIDSTVAKPRDFDLLRYAKAFLWVMIHAEITPDDGQPGRDHLRSDAFRPMLDLCYSTSDVAKRLLPETRSSNNDELIFDLERYLAMLKLVDDKSEADLDGTGEEYRAEAYKGYVREILEFFDGVRPDDFESNGRPRRRWDRLVALHLLTLAFIDDFHYNRNRDDIKSRTRTAVTMLLYPETLQREFDVWLPRLGLARAREVGRVRAALARVVRDRVKTETVDDRANRVYCAVRENRERRPLPSRPDQRVGKRTTWGEGDYAQIGDRLSDAADKAIKHACVGENDRVLDLACGTGNAALLAAGLGARTVAVDFEPRMLEQANRREFASLVDWRLADVTDLRLAGEKFSVVLSVFGVMYAQDANAAACQLARCCDEGARIAITTWRSGSFMPEMELVFARHIPSSPKEAGSSVDWGDKDALASLFKPYGVQFETHDEVVVLDYPDLDAATECLVASAGHVVHERDRLEREGRWDALIDELRAFVAERSEGDGEDVRLSLEYLLAVGECTAATPAEGCHEDS